MNFFMTMKAPSLPSCSFLKYRNHGSLVSGETMRTSNGPTCSSVEKAFALAALALVCCIDLMWDMAAQGKMHRANQRLSGKMRKMRTKGPGGRMCCEVRRQSEASHTFASSQNSIPRREAQADSAITLECARRLG